MEHRFPTCDEELQLLRASAALWPGLGKIEVIILLRNCELLAQLIELRLFCLLLARYTEQLAGDDPIVSFEAKQSSILRTPPKAPTRL